MDDEAVRGTYILGAVEILAPALRAGSDLQAMVEQESAQGLRVLLFTSVPELVLLRNADDQPTLPHGLIPFGLISLSDELRPQTRETLGQLSETGIRFKVISGDHPQTVAALVKQAGLSSDIRAVSGLDLATMDAAHFATTTADATVFARTPLLQSGQRLLWAFQSWENPRCDPHQYDAHEEGGSRGHVCDRHTQPCLSVTNETPRPSLFAQATVSSFRVCVPTSQRERTTGVVELPGGSIGRGKRSKRLFSRKSKEDCNELGN